MRGWQRYLDVRIQYQPSQHTRGIVTFVAVRIASTNRFNASNSDPSLRTLPPFPAVPSSAAHPSPALSESSRSDVQRQRVTPIAFIIDRFARHRSSQPSATAQSDNPRTAAHTGQIRSRGRMVGG